ncbi:hypothetical protein F5Y04DRAFT_187007 [Hypomontagnella monticulosa]|nr:hypothetical protein F5Y04DRAFT_187007 [Hypomontagnella monticulosa]
MSIQRLPDHVIAQIKSSTVITSLNGVICGLVKNSLDAEATKITVSVDYARGNCSVEDNGLGIPPSEFSSAGSLGKLHFTSKYPARNDIHGRHGAFLASVAALSLMSITSHHHGYHSHNSIQIRNSEILARYTPSLPEQRLLSFPHGTRTTVRDLFGAMPVRVKQRAIDSEKGTNAKDWELLKRSLVALLLAWPGQVSLSLHDSVDRHNFIIRIPEQSPDVLDIITRVSRTLFQAQLSDDRSRDLWVPLKASTGPVSIVGAVSLLPIASRQVQFISIGVRPISNDQGSNVLYEEINRLFANSSFGVEEESGDHSENERKRRAKDRRFKSDGYTNQELKGRKGVDRWPMFYIRIDIWTGTSQLAECDVEEILDGRRESLRTIIDILTAVVYEFLKAHHLRPKYSRPRKVTSSKSSSRSSTPGIGSRTDRSRVPQNNVSTGDLASTRLNLIPNAFRPRPESPFDAWTRIKSGQPQYAHLQAKHPSGSNTVAESGHDESRSETGTPPIGNDDDILDKPLVAPDGSLLRIPFLDVEMDAHDTGQEHSPEKNDLAGEQSQAREGEVLWTSPTTKETFAIDNRTGLVIQPLQGESEDPDGPDGYSRRTLRKRLRTNTKPIPKDKRSEWLGDLLSSWDNPVFKLQEPSIPVAFGEDEVLAMVGNAHEGHCHGCDSGSLDFLRASHSVEGRLSKDSLRNAKVLAQVDRKFILARVPLSSSSASSASREINDSLLVIIDQHAADERCRVEALMRDYFIVEEDTQHPPMGHKQLLARAQMELLDEPIVFDVSNRDCRQFEHTAEYFRRWGITFRIGSTSKSKLDGKATARLRVLGLPPSIAERCRLEPRLLIELLRKEAWKLDEQGCGSLLRAETEVVRDEDGNDSGLHWLARFHGCPGGITEMINSRACRSSIMFNDYLSHEECVALVERLANCTLPFQCAHGRPSMVPLVDLGNLPMKLEDIGEHKSSFGEEYRRWKSTK